MRTLSSRLAGATALAMLLALCPAPARADEIPEKYRKNVENGLKWLQGKAQKEREGSLYWTGGGGMYAVSMTSLAGMAFLMEGSTMREGRFQKEIRGATEWLMKRSQRNGLIGNPGVASEAGQYVYGHGFAMLFLSCVLGEEDNPLRRRTLTEILEKAAKYSLDAQTDRGGWGYVSAKDGSNFDEGSVTITQVQGLRAARNAGVVVPNEVITSAQKYLEMSTNSQGGVIYSLASGWGGGPGRPALTAAACCCGFSFGEYDSPLVKKWIKFCQENLGSHRDGRRMGHDEYTHYYFAQVVYVLGDDRYGKLFPKAPKSEWLTWSKYREELFSHLVSTQDADGGWGSRNPTSWGVGPVYAAALHLSMMQLDRAALPVYQR